MNYDPKIIAKIDLTVDATKQELIGVMKKAIMQDDSLESKRANDFLNQYFKVQTKFINEHKEIYKEILDLQIACRWVALPIINDAEVLDCFDKYISIGWSIPNVYGYFIDKDQPYSLSTYFIKQKVINRLNTYLELEDRDKLKNKIQDILINSEQLITTERLVQEKTLLKPTLKNWFILYFADVGTGQTNKLKMAQFFSTNANFRKLVPDDQEKLKAIFNLYELFKLSSRAREGNEQEISYEDEEGPAVVQYGQIERIPKRDLEYFHEYIEKNKEALLKDKIITRDFLEKMKQRENSEQIQEQTINKPSNKLKTMISDIPKYKETNEPKGVAHDIFSDADQQEIAGHKASTLRQQNEMDYAGALAKLKQQFSLQFTDAVYESRFDNLVLSYLKGLRDVMECKEMLTRPFNVGGLDYHMDLAEQIVDSLKNIPTALSGTSSSPVGVTAMPKITEAAAPMPSYDQVQQVMEKPQPAPMKAPAARAATPPLPVFSSKNPVPKAGGAIPQVKRLNPNKPIVQDIKIPPQETKLIGPIEELGSLDLKKFRKMAATPVEAAEKIKAKIDLLEEQSFTEKAKAIVAYKNSPLNRIYLAIGNKSIEEGRPVVEVINEMGAAGQAVFAKEEFDIIADLNRKLRF
ncbi:MAG: hypothetical protein WC752_02060 [Patescibacteria group bacterium]|jgi:hypothetical protein